ncbi:MAG: tetratricopeptide repeat protein, partial [Candidatus Poribacteria bacterium]|nr:tetratricopeptide repeat protein [Candidatus Poribacteria bacterium]
NGEFDARAEVRRMATLVSSTPQIFAFLSQRGPLLSILLDAAALCRSVGEPEDARVYCEQVLNFAAAGEDSQLRAEAFRRLANLQFLGGDLSRAQANYQHSLNLYETEGNAGLSASIYNRLGDIATQQGNFELAKNYHRQAIVMSEPDANLRIIAIAYNGLGIIADMQSDWEAASDYFGKSVDLYETLDLPEQTAAAYVNLAMAYNKCGEWEAAGLCYTVATAIAEKLSQNPNESPSNYLPLFSVIYINRAEFLLNLASIEEAQFYCDKAMAISRRTKENIAVADTCKLYGRICRYRKEWDIAIEYFTQSLQRHRSGQNLQGEAEVCYEFGLMYRDCHDVSQARRLLQKSRCLYERLASADKVRQVDMALADL